MFDAYHKWLGIPKDQRPPTYYQLLGIATGESDPEVIEEAAVRQMAHVRTYQIGKHADDCQRILNEIAQAKQSLLKAEKRKSYDEQLARAQGKKAGVKAPATGVLVSTPAASPDFRIQDADSTPPVLARNRINMRRRSSGNSAAVWISVGAFSVLAVVVGIVAMMKLAGRPEPVKHSPPPLIKKDDRKEPKTTPKVVQELPPDKEKPAVVAKAPVEKQPMELPRPPVEVAIKAHPGARGFPVKEQVARLALAPDGNKVAVSFIHGNVYDIATGDHLATLPPTKRGGFIRTPVAFFADSLRVLYAYGGEPALVIGEAATGVQLHRLEQEGVQYADCLAVAPNSQRALAGYNYRLVYWDLETREEIQAWPLKHIPNTLVISRDGRLAVVGANDGTLYVWDLERREKTRERRFAELSGLQALAISPDGRRVAAATGKGLVVVEIPDLRLTTLDFSEGRVQHSAVAFCEQGKALLAGGADGVMRFYDLEGPRLRFAWRGHAGEVTQIAVDAKERIAVSGDKIGMVYVWPLTHVAGGAGP